MRDAVLIAIIVANRSSRLDLLGKEIIRKTIPISQSGSLESGTSPGNIVTNERRCHRGGIYAN